jgi:hypothetical protein
MYPYDMRAQWAIASREARRSAGEYEGMKNRWVRMPWRSSAVISSRVSGSRSASYSRATERAHSGTRDDR